MAKKYDSESDWGADEAKEIVESRYISGFATKDNLKDWASYAKGNSYLPDRAGLKHDLGTEGALKDYAARDVEDWRVPQRKSEGRGWSKSMGIRSNTTGLDQD